MPLVLIKKKKKRQWLDIEQLYVAWTFSLDFVFRTQLCFKTFLD